MKNFLIASLFMAATIAPWTYRNWRVLHAWVPISTNGGDVFYRANNPLATGTWTPRGERSLPPDDEVEANRLGYQWGKEWIVDQLRHHPRVFLRLTARKIFIFWHADEAPMADATGDRKSKYWSSRVFWIALIGLTAWSIYTRRRNRNLWLLLLPVAFLSSVHAVYESQQRYHMPVIPFLIIVAVLGVLPQARIAIARRTSLERKPEVAA